jgi:amino-acid N-acetyltransferase
MTTITSAGPEDLPEILGLLDRCELPQDGLKTSAALVLVAKESDALLGCAALEAYGTVGLLRSVAVDPGYRSQALGRELVERMLVYGKHLGIREVYLLTESATDYFPRFGFRPIARQAVSPAIHASVEWTSACPVSAQAMICELEAGEG